MDRSGPLSPWSKNYIKAMRKTAMNGSSMQPGDKQTLQLLGMLIGSLILLMVVLISVSIAIHKGRQQHSGLETELFLGKYLVAQNVNVEMEDGLPGIRSIIDDGAEGIADAQLFGHHTHLRHQVA